MIFKRSILVTLVDVIWVDTVKRTFTIEGEIKGTYSIDDDSGSSGGGFALGFTRTLRE